MTVCIVRSSHFERDIVQCMINCELALESEPTLHRTLVYIVSHSAHNRFPFSELSYASSSGSESSPWHIGQAKTTGSYLSQTSASSWQVFFRSSSSDALSCELSCTASSGYESSIVVQGRLGSGVTWALELEAAAIELPGRCCSSAL